MPSLLFKNAIQSMLLVLLIALVAGCNSQKAFPTPEAAVDSFVGALKTNDRSQLRDILGWSGQKILVSGDPVADQNDFEKFVDAYREKHTLVTEDNGDMTLVVGNKDWPLPIPLVKQEKKGWIWDAAAGKEEIISRRVGRNELDTIQTCLAIVDAQRDYATMDPEHLGIQAYAQKFMSDPGRKNGLYYPTEGTQPPSPLGELAAVAQEQGYSLTSSSKPRPYHGYYFRMLKAQGPNAPGGARDYMSGAKMLWGFGVVAYPVEYGKSGVMSFIVSQDGDVHQKDLGDGTASAASHMMSFDPDASWAKVASVTPPVTTPATMAAATQP